MPLNRAQRRRLSRRVAGTISHQIRVHEAGHAVARYFTANLLGWPVEDSVQRVEFGTRAEQVKKDNAGVLRCYQGTTFGHFLSREMNELFRPYSRGGLTPTREHFAMFEKAGIDLDTWSLVRYILTLAGVVAEYKHTGEKFLALLYTDAAKADARIQIADAKLLGRKAANIHHFSVATRMLCRLFDAPGIWPATLAVAEALKAGVTPGALVWTTFAKAMGSYPIPSAAPGEEPTLVRVRRDWNDARREALFRLDQLRDFHWTDTAGGTGRKAPVQLLHAYVWCSDMISGDLAHSCEHGPGPHNIKICVPNGTNAEVWREIEISAAWSLHERSL
jgi:hypothetical protein